MKKSIILGVMLSAIAMASVALASSGTIGAKSEIQKKQEPKQKKAKRTTAQKIQHAESKSNGKAYSGKGKGPVKSHSNKPKKMK